MKLRHKPCEPVAQTYQNKNFNMSYNFDDLFSEEAMLEVNEESSIDKDEDLFLLLKLYATGHEKKKGFAAIRRGLEGRLTSIIGRDSLTDDAPQRKLFYTFSTLASQIIEQTQLPQLRQKCVVGVGGRFSAGKSRFLNAITGMTDCLPIGQLPTTAVATYLVHQSEKFISAYTTNETVVHLTKDELQIVAHTFFENYKIGFSSILQKIVIGIPEFLWPDIALLDTPGYDRDEANGAHNRKRDEQIAREHLSNCDYVIWLADAQSGTLSETDIEFISSLHMVNPCLVIFNKADKKAEEELLDIIDTCKKYLDASGIDYAGVAAFSSFENKEYLGQSILKDYLDQAKLTEKSHLNTHAALERIKKDWLSVSNKRKKTIEEARKRIWNGIAYSENPQHIKSLVEAYGLSHKHNAELYRQQNAFEEEIDRLLKKY
jgi:GTP-binding protein EngB required for normal cell division